MGLGEGFDLRFVELVVVDQLQDQILLLFGALPMPVEGTPVLLVFTIGKRCAVSALGDEPGALDFVIHTPLEGVVETIALVSDVFDAADLSFDAN